MKIAVCISGDIRTYKHCYKSLFSFLDGCEYDIYLTVKHKYYNEKSAELRSIYNPITKYVPPVVNYDLQMKHIFKMYDGYPNVNILEMTSDMLALLDVWNDDYDFIVRTRYDSIFEGKLKDIINSIDMNTLYIPDVNNHHMGFNDTFALGSPKIMKEYFNWNSWLIENIDTKFDNYYPEILLREYCRSKKIRVKFSNILNTKVLRQEHIGLSYEFIPNTSPQATAERNKTIDDIRYRLTNNRFFKKPLKIHTYLPKMCFQNEFILRKMTEGIINSGENDCHIVDKSYNDYAPPHILVTFGCSTYEPELNIKMQQMISQHKQNKNPLLVMETALIGRNHSIYSNGYFRVAWNGFMHDTGTFTDEYKQYSSDRWNKIKKEFNIDMKPWKKEGKYILLIHQVNSDSSIRGNDFSMWLNNTINEIKKYTDRPIKLRLHPHPVFTPVYPKRSDIEISYGTTLQQDLESAWAVVSFTSGASIDSILYGVPVFAMNPGNMAFSVSNYTLKNLESPIYPDREQWINRLSYSQWNIDEIKSGECWNHMKTFMPTIYRMPHEYL